MVCTILLEKTGDSLNQEGVKMDDKVDFLWQRQNDMKKFSFQYTNNSGDVKTHYPEGIKDIDITRGVAALQYPNGVYKYSIGKMRNLNLVDHITIETAHIEKIIENLPVEEYFSKLVKYLINIRMISMMQVV